MIVLNYIAFIILLIGALNWGLIGLFGFNLVSFCCFGMNVIARVIYVLVLAAAIYLIVMACIHAGIFFAVI